jgi:hypothetical protein
LTGFVIRNYTQFSILIAITIYWEIWQFLAPLALDIQANAMGKNRECYIPTQYLISDVYSHSAGQFFLAHWTPARFAPERPYSNLFQM